MARTCFCGCGRRLGFGDRSISKKGAKISEEVEFIETYCLPMSEASDDADAIDAMCEFIADGQSLRHQVAGVLHGEVDARSVDRHAMAAWHGFAKRMIGETKVTLYKASNARE